MGYVTIAGIAVAMLFGRQQVTEVDCASTPSSTGRAPWKISRHGKIARCTARIFISLKFPVKVPL